jgi:hypothetical protein
MGAGFVLDVFVGYLWRCTARLFVWTRTNHWKSERGVVSSVSIEPAYALGCPLVTVAYEADNAVAGEAISKIPFLLQGSAEDYAGSLREGDVIAVRVNPKNRSQTAFFPSDRV